MAGLSRTGHCWALQTLAVALALALAQSAPRPVTSIASAGSAQRDLDTTARDSAFNVGSAIAELFPSLVSCGNLTNFPCDLVREDAGDSSAAAASIRTGTVADREYSAAGTDGGIVVHDDSGDGAAGDGHVASSVGAGDEGEHKDEDDAGHHGTTGDADQAKTDEDKGDSAGKKEVGEEQKEDGSEAKKSGDETKEGGDETKDSSEGDKKGDEEEKKDGAEPKQGDDQGKEGEGDKKDDGTQTDAQEGEKSDDSAASASEGLSKNGTDATAPDSGTNVTEALLAFTLKRMRMIDDGTSFKLVNIFENGDLVGDFESNPNSSDISTLSADVDEKGWFSDGAYADRIAFKFTYSQDADGYAISEPKLQVRTSAGIEPSVKDYHNDASEGSGSFTIQYRCMTGAAEKSYISLHMQITKEHSVDTIWIKTCGKGRNEHINFGFVDSENSLTLFNPDGTYGTSEQQMLEVGPLEQSTDLRVQLTAPQWDLMFADPHVESDNMMVSVALRGTIKGGSLSSDEATTFSVMYHQCEQTTAKAKISFTFAIPPWDNVTATWRKDCGGSHSQALLIGTSKRGSFEVMQDGELNASYNVTEQTTVDEAIGKVEEIAEGKSSARFYVTNSDDTSAIHIQTIATTMSDPNVLSTVVQVPFGGSSSYLPAGGATIARRETKSLLFHFICKRRGTSLVLVTLPIVKYKNVEFGFIKHCLEPQVHHHSGFLQTAGSIMGTVLVLLVVGGIGGWVHLRRRAEAKYAAVPTSDRIP